MPRETLWFVLSLIWLALLIVGLLLVLTSSLDEIFGAWAAISSHSARSRPGRSRQSPRGGLDSAHPCGSATRPAPTRFRGATASAQRPALSKFAAQDICEIGCPKCGVAFCWWRSSLSRSRASFVLSHQVGLDCSRDHFKEEIPCECLTPYY